VCKDTACIIYEKKTWLYKMNVGIVLGLVNYHNTINPNSFLGGFVTDISRSNMTIYFRTGIWFSQYEPYADDVHLIFTIPIQIEYIYPKGVVRPKLALGINVHSYAYSTLAIMGGMNIKLSKRLSAIVNYDIEFGSVNADTFPLVPQAMISQSISSGIQMNF
jgi:hypothetical protein